MNKLAICHGRVVTPVGILAPATVVIEGARITEIIPGEARPAGARLIDAAGCVVAPGFIDVHVHGGAGYDTMDATPAALRGMAEFFASHGVTGFLPTTVAAEHAALLKAVENVAAQQGKLPDGARVLGVHLEGPYLSHAHPGAQPPQHIRPADPAEYSQLFAWDNVRLVSLAPEIPANRALIEYAMAHGAAVAVGHSGATYDEVMEAVALGVSQACHTFNGMTGLHHREPGTVGAVLTSDEIYAQVIVDLVHVHPAVVRLLLRAKGIERVILITDAMRAAGLADGEYELAGQMVHVQRGVACLARGNSLAGSVLTMDQAVRNMLAVSKLPLEDVLLMASGVPARALKLDHELGAIQAGYYADLVLLDQDMRARQTIVQGELIYQAVS